MLIGNDDVHNSDPENNYLKRLQAKHANVKLAQFSGGHEMTTPALVNQLAKLLDQ